MIYFDAHVHIQDNYSIDVLFDSARRNFSRQMQQYSPDRPAAFFLLLAEAKNSNYYAELKKEAEIHRYLSPGGWQVAATPEPESLLLTRDDWPAGRLFLVAGRQLVSVEKLEVLALATSARIADHQALPEMVEAVRSRKGLAVLPWGAGKWLGKRGKIIERFLATASAEGLFVGDNGGRPSFWPTPRPFIAADTRGIKLLPGSDPLPLPEEELRVGSCGGRLEGNCSNDCPAAELRKLLTTQSQKIIPFGRRLGTWQFVRNQLALRL